MTTYSYIKYQFGCIKVIHTKREQDNSSRIFCVMTQPTVTGALTSPMDESTLNSLIHATTKHSSQNKEAQHNKV